MTHLSFLVVSKCSRRNGEYRLTKVASDDDHSNSNLILCGFEKYSRRNGKYRLTKVATDDDHSNRESRCGLQEHKVSVHSQVVN